MNRPRLICTGAVLAVVLRTSTLAAQGIVPPECFLDQQDDAFNSCKYCHTSGFAGAGKDDADKQRNYPSGKNLFLNALDPTRLDALVPPETIPADLSIFLDFDNYRPALEARGSAPGLGAGQGPYKYFPDLDPELTGADGFADNGWRAFKWKPNELAWPRYNGRIQLNWVRMHDRFQRDESGALDLAVYKQNLDLLVEVVGGKVAEGTYHGMAQNDEIIPYRFPAGTEIAHYLYYLDPDQPDMKAIRVKEVLVNVKSVPEEFNQRFAGFVSAKEKELSLAHREENAGADHGLIYNKDGWDLVGFIEDVDGALRPQTRAEMNQCVGCHSLRLGAIRDSHWNSMQRKLPGQEGWALQDYRGIFDYYNAQLDRGEYAEIFENYFGDARSVPGLPDGTVDFFPPAAEADALNRRYYQIVQSQSFFLGRDPKLASPGFLADPEPNRAREDDQAGLWNPELNFAAFELMPSPTAVETGRRDTGRPAHLALSQNVPNPLNPATAMEYWLPTTGRAALAVYNLNGQLVRALVDEEQAAGSHRASWDGRDGKGRPVATGPYVYRLVQGDRTAARKMLLVR